jgi:glycosyltransferase involved in cell wall biosynthesis
MARDVQVTTLPFATVVVPAFNAASTIDECLRSLLELDYPPELREIVVVDNGSHDATLAVLERYSSRIVCLREARRGPSAARNAGIRRARGDVVAFTDADCTVDPDWLRELVQPLEDDAVGIAGGRIMARKEANEAELYGETIHDQHTSILVWRPPYVIGMNWASRRAVLEEASLFDEGMRRVEDVCLSYQIGSNGYSLVYCPKAIVYHRNEGSLLGLCREGWQHGFYAVPVLRRFGEYVAEARAWPPSTVMPTPPSRVLRQRYGRAFRTGKRVGRAMGKAWFGLTR